MAGVADDGDAGHEAARPEHDCPPRKENRTVPGLNGTGPRGLGPGTGRGFGLCREVGLGFPGRGMGGGFGWLLLVAMILLWELGERFLTSRHPAG